MTNNTTLARPKRTTKRRARRRDFTRYPAPRYYTRTEIAALETIWKRDFKAKVGSKLFGELTFELVQEPEITPALACLKISIGRSSFIVMFTSDEWMDVFFDIVADDIDMAKHHSVLALALESQFIKQIEKIEKLMQTEITFQSLTFDLPRDGLLENRGVQFKTVVPQFGSFDITVIPADAEAETTLMDMLSKTIPARPVETKAGHHTPLNCQILADITQMPASQLRNLKPGAGLVLGANWIESTPFDLNVAGQKIGTVQKADDTYKITELALQSKAAPATRKKPTTRARRAAK